MKIILTGGGTAGSVIPLLAIYTKIKKQEPSSQFLFIGTKKGNPETKLLKGYAIEYASVFGGKLRRYLDIKNITDLVLIFIGFIQSIIIHLKFKPDIIVATGSYISVPVIWAGWVLKIKILIHQLDIRPSLSNILTMNFANKISVTFEKSLKNFPSSKTIWTGNPVRDDVFQGGADNAYNFFKLNKKIPIVLIIGGGTGALAINTIVNQALPNLVNVCQIVHITGLDKRITGIDNKNYQQYEFLKDEIKDILLVANIIVSRAGLSALTEYSVLKKPVILVPMPKSHQEENAQYFADKEAAIVIKQKDLSPNRLTSKIKELIDDKSALSLLSKNISMIMKPQATESITDQIIQLIKK